MHEPDFFNVDNYGNTQEGYDKRKQDLRSMAKVASEKGYKYLERHFLNRIKNLKKPTNRED